ncbi:CBS domain-containing protein [Bdellovibrio sp. qaytius]|nr:CBS domain-containing protein [Bdellovibrio sp. qaytius]
MLVHECMSNYVELGRPDMTLKEVSCLMRDGDYGFLPIQENDRLIGTLTDRDITIRAVAAGLSPDTTKVYEVMSKKVLYCYEDQTLEEVTRNLGDNQVRRLPVLNRDKRLVGVLSLGDLSQAELAAEQFESAVSRISQSTPSSRAGRNMQ